jgi:phosphoglycolate phosphatase-like HAD superfamily hydrolase
MFGEMRKALGIPKSIDILDHIKSLSSEPDQSTPAPSTVPSESSNIASALDHTASPPDTTPSSPQSRAVAAIKAIERNAMTSQHPQPGLGELMTYLESRGMRKALCTRNFPAPVHHLLQNHLEGITFEPIITRETEGIAPKPSPEGLWMIARAWGLGADVEEGERKSEDPLELARTRLGSGLIMVGDSMDDLKAGYRAGAATVLLVNEENEHLRDVEECDLAVSRLDELVVILDRGFEGRA